MKEGMKILVAYDGSDHSKRALSEAIMLTQKFSGSLTLLHCCWVESDQASMVLLKDVRGQLEVAGIKHEFSSVRTNTPPASILIVAEENGYDMIVMGSRGMGGARALLLGSVSTRVAAEASVPVLIVK
jgi:nucleotide-binding universal stress UspA family protein